jgi:AcrR family transcriptional regulator
MTPAPTDHEARRAELTDALLSVVAERGLEATSVRAVAAAAGVSIGTVQHYFPTKDAMLRDAYRAIGRDLGERAERRAAAAGSAREAIREVLLELTPLDERRTAAVRVGIAFAVRALQAPDLAAELRADLAELRDGIAGAFAAAGAADPRREALAAIALSDGLGSALLFAGPATITPDEAVAVLDDHLDRALAAS